MSLINDALKRASQSQKERAAEPPPPSAPPLQPVVDSGPAGASPLLVPVLVLVVLGLAGLAFWKWWQNSQPATTTTAAISAASPSVAASAKPAPAESGSVSGAHRLNSPSEIQINTNPVVHPGAPPERAAVVAAPAPTPTPVATTAAAPTLAPVPPATTPASNAVANPTPVAVETPPAKPQFPELKLQGIFYRLRNPSVMINNQTLYKGDDIAGAKVIEIERQDVTVEFNGEKRVLAIH
jgi:cytoskeletal protein RodZ